MSETKLCRKCGKTKSHGEFGKDCGRPDGLYPYCKVCRRANDKITGKKYRQSSNGQRVQRAAGLKWKYGVTLAEYDVMFEAQGGVCAICGKPEIATDKSGVVKRLAVDHDHDSGKIRGLLCFKCNSMVGFVQDDSDIFLKVSDYLRRHAA